MVTKPHAAIIKHDGVGSTRCFHANASYSAFDVVVIGASMGGVSALTMILSSLPADFPAPIVVTQHLSPHYSSQLASILNARSPLSVKWAADDLQAKPGTVYLAPPDRHVLITSGLTLSLSASAKVQFTRPSVDVLFTSAALHCTARTLGVVLTGRGSDGAEGVTAIKRAGGRVICQDAGSSVACGMPAAAAATGCVNLTLPLRAVAPALVTLVMAPGATPWFT